MSARLCVECSRTAALGSLYCHLHGGAPTSEGEVAILERRLEIGWEMCEREDDPNEQHRLEDYWLQLLADYERAVDRERQQEVRQSA